MTQYNKLVRDNIPDVIISRGGTCSTHVVTGVELQVALERKLEEEVAELLSGENKKEELADIFEVLDALLLVYGIDEAEVKILQAIKREGRGGFEKGIILEEAPDI